MKDKNHMMISIDAKKEFCEIQQSSVIKILYRVGIEGLWLNIKKAIYDKPITRVLLSGEEPFLKDQEQDKRAHSHHFCPT